MLNSPSHDAKSGCKGTNKRANYQIKHYLFYSFERKCLLAERKEHLGTLRGEAGGKPTEGRILARVNEIDIPRLVIKNLHFFWLFKENILTLQQIYKYF